jgi:hypothetical protein
LTVARHGLAARAAATPPRLLASMYGSR